MVLVFSMVYDYMVIGKYKSDGGSANILFETDDSIIVRTSC